MNNKKCLGTKQGKWIEYVNKINKITNFYSENLEEIKLVSENVIKGDLSQKYTINAKGDMLEIKRDINKMIDQMDKFSKEYIRLSNEIGREGSLGGKANINGAEGVWLEMTNGLNDMSEIISEQIRGITEVAEAIIAGDLSKKVTVDSNGEFLKLKKIINSSIDQLYGLVSEITKASTKVSEEGDLGVKLRIYGATGAWLDLVNSLNEATNNVMLQIKSISDVLGSLAKGELSQKVTINTKGEMLKIQEDINLIISQVSQVTSEVINVTREVGTDGKFGGNVKSDELKGVWLETCSGVNNMVSSVTNQIRNISEATNAVVKGDLTKKITIDVRGESLELKNNINQMIDNLLFISSEINSVAEEVAVNGEFAYQAEVSGVSGIWFDMISAVNRSVNVLGNQLGNISEVTKAVANGDLSKKITINAKGEIFELKRNVNNMVETLLLISSEVTRVAREVGIEGILGGQAKVHGVSGAWFDLTNSVNKMADALTEQVRNISEVTEAVANGDLSQKVTVNAKGEVLELKRTINTTLGQLVKIGSEVSRVAREVGTDGLLGGQARVEGITGVWLELINDINRMTESLTNQVSSLSEVALDVARGNLTRNVSSEVKGEFLELKESLNTMISNLAEVDAENRAQNWIKDGVSILSKEILYKDKLSEQFSIAIKHLARYVNAGMGVIYIYNSSDELIEVEATYACLEDNDNPTVFKIGEGIIGQVAKDRSPILISDDSNGKVIQTGTNKYRVVSTYTTPLVFKDMLVGVIELATYNEFTDLQIEYIESAISVLSGSFYAGIQAKDKQRLEAISIKDALTGLYNRGYFDDFLPKLIETKKQKNKLVCFAMLDIDFFKKINDKHGHHIGDAVLREISSVLRNSIRENDYCFRVGGEEFAILFEAKNSKKAYKVAHRIKNAVEEMEVLDENDNLLKGITISIGLTCKKAHDIVSIGELYEETDKLLYTAKKTGRNKVVSNN